MSDIKPKDIKDLNVDQRAELAARYALESLCSVVSNRNYLDTLAGSDPKVYAALIVQLMKLQADLEKAKQQRQEQASNQPTNITVSFIKPDQE